MAEYRPLTVERIISDAEAAEEQGLEEIGAILRELSTRVARYNETHPFTVEQIRLSVGEDNFWDMWKRLMNG